MLLSRIVEMRLKDEEDNQVYCIYEIDAFCTLTMIVSSMYATFMVHINSNSFIQQEYKMHASRTYNELEKIDYLEGNFYALIELAKNIAPFLITRNEMSVAESFSFKDFPEEL
jgi:short-subunit dehydrogenase involved in D-alanine esterification of teichoic acids